MSKHTNYRDTRQQERRRDATENDNGGRQRMLGRQVRMNYGGGISRTTRSRGNKGNLAQEIQRSIDDDTSSAD